MSIQNKIERVISRSFIGCSKCGHSLHTFFWLIGEAIRAAQSYLFKNKYREMLYCFEPAELLRYRTTDGSFTPPRYGWTLASPQPSTCRLLRIFRSAGGYGGCSKRREGGGESQKGKKRGIVKGCSIVLSLLNCLKPGVTEYTRIPFALCVDYSLIGPREMRNLKKTVSN